MDLQKRNCGIEMKLVPYGAGWADVYLNIGGDELYFIISYYFGDQFSDLMKVLYYLFPKNNDPVRKEEQIECWEGLCELIDGNFVVTKIVEHADNETFCVTQPIPYKGEFTWDEEGAHSRWSIQREPTVDTDFDIHIEIEVHRAEVKKYAYIVRYKDFCYAVAKACTQVLKAHGIYGYHHSVYYEDMNLRYLLFLKSVALDKFEARKLTFNGDGQGESTSFEKELELLLFDM